MSNGQRTIGPTMRPNIDITHTLNGRVKDYAAANDMTVDEAYEKIIKCGLAELKGEIE